MSKPYWWPDLQAIVAISTIGLFGALLFMLLFRPMPMTEASGQLLTTLAGMLAGSFVSVVSFYFGSSTQSKAKDDTIATLTKQSGETKP